MNWKAHIETYRRLDHCNKARLFFEQVIKWRDEDVINTTKALNVRNKKRRLEVVKDS